MKGKYLMGQEFCAFINIKILFFKCFLFIAEVLGVSSLFQAQKNHCYVRPRVHLEAAAAHKVIINDFNSLKSEFLSCP